MTDVTRLRQAWASGRPTINGWLSVGSTMTAEIMAAQGFDSICIDLQHGAIDYASMLPMLQTLSAFPVLPFVRVPWLEPGIIMKSFDAGAYGVICPMVSTAAQAAEFVSHVRYPPEGARSFGPTRIGLTAGPAYAREANGQILAFAMIETAEAMANLHAIAITPGLDGLYVGPADLTFGLHRGELAPGFDREEPVMIDALKQIAVACRQNGIVAALHCGSAVYAARATEWGYGMLTVSNDVRLLAASARAAVDQFRACVERGPQQSERTQ